MIHFFWMTRYYHKKKLTSVKTSDTFRQSAQYHRTDQQVSWATHLNTAFLIISNRIDLWKRRTVRVIQWLLIPTVWKCNNGWIQLFRNYESSADFRCPSGHIDLSTMLIQAQMLEFHGLSFMLTNGYTDTGTYGRMDIRTDGETDPSKTREDV